MSEPLRIGGSFAPPLTDEKIAECKQVMAGASAPVAEAMGVLLKMAEHYHSGPIHGSKSTDGGIPHPSGTGLIVPLPQDEVDRIFDAVPWDHELDMYAKLFEGIDNDSNKPLRDAAFHLLWYGRELFLDRQPITSDRL